MKSVMFLVLGISTLLSTPAVTVEEEEGGHARSRSSNEKAALGGAGAREAVNLVEPPPAAS